MPASKTRTTLLINLALCVGLVGCAAPRMAPPPAPELPPGELMRANLAGSWERDYSRDDDVNTTLQRAYNLLAKSVADQRLGTPNRSGMSPRQASALVALARLAELITRPDVLTISQTDHEISVSRKDDFSMLCQFFDTGPKSTSSAYGRETCGWQGRDLVSVLQLPEGLKVVHQFTLSEDEERLRVVTTVSSPTSPVPFSLRRFYRKFERLPPEYNCIETLSMKRVCSTGELEL
ncbi:MAG: hypothetical protein QNJ05_00765 [Woeseiaceae bacterium]|nr:hypothetical protein [Woeseiaceae bacterium]